MKKIHLLLVCILIPFVLFAQAIPDATVVVHQNTINGFFTAIGPVSGTEQYNVLGMKGDYTWTVDHARIELKPDQAKFIADAHIKIGPIPYSSEVNGEVEVRYHPITNRISIKVLSASFEIYFKVFGKKVHIADVDVSKFYRPEFEFAGPQPIQAKVDVVLPGDVKKSIYITPYDQFMKIEPERIVVTSQLRFTDQPPAPVPVPEQK